MGKLLSGKPGTFPLFLLVTGALWLPGWTGALAFAGQTDAPAYAGQTPAATTQPSETAAPLPAAGSVYRTPLAGAPLHTSVLGREVDIPAESRDRVTALTLGGVLYAPKQGATSATPIGALFLKRVWAESRTRDEISIFVNDLEYDREYGHWDLVTRLENYTVPGGQREVVNNKEIKSSDTQWGTVVASLGPGLRYRVAPFENDNDVRLQLLGKVGYFYATRTKDTGPNLVLPPDTMLYGVKLRGRYDGMRRNLLELPHTGMAAGFDLDYTRRDHWSDFGTAPDAFFSKANTQDYFQSSGYLMGVAGIPGLSERNRVFFSLHGGVTPQKSADRYNAISIGGGPLPGESDDLCRPDYPGTMFNQVLVSKYGLAALEYRRELAFFLYLHLRETYIWADRAAVDANDRFLFKYTTGAASTIGLDTGFFWNSELYLGYSWDTGFVRNGKPGSGIILTWNKSFE
jgi:hypothetical protein